MGRFVVENGQIQYDRNESSMLDFLRTTPEAWGRLPSRPQEVAFSTSDESLHRRVMENFDAALRDPSTPLIAHGTEGIRSLSLGNAVMLSSWLEKTVALPFDEDLYASLLGERIAASASRRARGAKGPAGLA